MCAVLHEQQSMCSGAAAVTSSAGDLHRYRELGCSTSMLLL
jgi:hypothetical protein